MATLNGQQQAQLSIEKLDSWIVKRDAAGDWKKYWNAEEDKLNRSLLADECDFGRSATGQNPKIKRKIESLDKRLRITRSKWQGDHIQVVIRNAADLDVQAIQMLLEPWLDARLEEWHALPESQRKPNLSNNGCKINVYELAVAIGMKRSQGKQLIVETSLRSAINAVATLQGLDPIDVNDQFDADDAVVRKRIARVASDRNDLARTLAEREAVVERQRLRIYSLEEQLRVRNETGMLFREECE
ncbi:MAG: hypothetical protein KA388_05135 [Rhodocyclaceae bacterium]|nr:hypothetical protein [Rhodocyclaceae bacterium]MBP6109444.1 hypothetical protein [Rhodocyclaceae bacterium]MBP6279127.1 hypothetical protein [Rhodocyclaceae bacterium]